MLRVLLTPRWVAWTVVLFLALLVCGGMTWWQIVRLESPGGSLLNAGYAFQWPLFGLFFLFLWARMLHAEATDTRGSEQAASSTAATSATTPASTPATPAPGAAPAVPAPVRPVPSASPFGPRPAGVGIGDDAPAAGSARAVHNDRFARLAGAAAPAPTPAHEERS